MTSWAQNKNEGFGFVAYKCQKFCSEVVMPVFVENVHVTHAAGGMLGFIFWSNAALVAGSTTGLQLCFPPSEPGAFLP